MKNLIHLVHSTKRRQPWIAKTLRDRLFAYQAGIYSEWDSPAIVIGGAEDRVHALFALSKNHPLKKIVEEVKKGSSKWAKIEGPKNADFYWQAGYGKCFSVSQSNLDDVKRYIENQGRASSTPPFSVMNFGHCLWAMESHLTSGLFGD